MTKQAQGGYRFDTLQQEWRSTNIPFNLCIYHAIIKSMAFYMPLRGIQSRTPKLLSSTFDYPTVRSDQSVSSKSPSFAIISPKHLVKRMPSLFTHRGITFIPISPILELQSLLTSHVNHVSPCNRFHILTKQLLRILF